MKKILYLAVGVIVAVIGIWMITPMLWWDEFLIIFKGLIGPMIVLAGAIVFIVGLMTPFKEEADDFDSTCDTNLEDDENNKEESGNTESK
ncbi:hypothetical protein LLG10_06085 [bacterium]|nr:hypothetical protein [bacterium]